MMFALAMAEVLNDTEKYAAGRGTFWYLFICFAFNLAVTYIDSKGYARLVYHPERQTLL